MELQQKFSLTVIQKISIFMKYGMHKTDSFMNYFTKLKQQLLYAGNMLVTRIYNFLMATG
jgi:hypothetical protein